MHLDFFGSSFGGLVRVTSVSRAGNNEIWTLAQKDAILSVSVFISISLE